MSSLTINQAVKTNGLSQRKLVKWAVIKVKNSTLSIKSSAKMHSMKSLLFFFFLFYHHRHSTAKVDPSHRGFISKAIARGAAFVDDQKLLLRKKKFEKERERETEAHIFRARQFYLYLAGRAGPFVVYCNACVKRIFLFILFVMLLKK